MSEAVRLAWVGLGYFGNVLADAATAAGGVVAGAYSERPGSRDAFVGKHGGVAYGSFDALLADPDVDGVVIATQNTTHHELVTAAATAGKHVFVEKPMTLSVESGRRAVAAAEAADVVLQVGHNQRRQPANRRLKRLIDAGELGTIMMIETHQSSPNALTFAEGYWRANHTESPLGGMTSLGVHQIDTMMYLLGPIERVSAFSREILDGPPMDHATAIVFEFASGALGYLGTSFAVPRATTVMVRGTRGVALNDQKGEAFARQSIDESALTYEPVEVLDTIADEMAEFVGAVRGETVPETGGIEGLRVIAVLEAAIRSRDSGRAEAPEPVG